MIILVNLSTFRWYSGTPWGRIYQRNVCHICKCFHMLCVVQGKFFLVLEKCFIPQIDRTPRIHNVSANLKETKTTLGWISWPSWMDILTCFQSEAMGLRTENEPVANPAFSFTLHHVRHCPTWIEVLSAYCSKWYFSTEWRLTFHSLLFKLQISGTFSSFFKFSQKKILNMI